MAEMLTCVLMAGQSSSGSGDLFKLSDRSNTTYFYYFPPQLALMADNLDLSVTTTTILPFGRWGAGMAQW